MEARLTAVDENEVLSYLGYKGGDIPKELIGDISAMSEQLIRLAAPRLTYRIFYNRHGKAEELESVLEGRDVEALLSNSRLVIIFGVTLGASVDAQLRRLQVTDMGKALIFDACANSGIENVCDNFCADAAEEYGFATDRFSPGYGDLPFERQAQFAAVLNLQRTIGVTLTDSGLMTPQKSVTAVFGISDVPQPTRFRGCSRCSLFRTCTLRKENRTCGKF